MEIIPTAGDSYVYSDNGILLQTTMSNVCFNPLSAGSVE